MNSIGKISLGFEGENQEFFQKLYGGLDDFIFTAIEKPTDEVLMVYDKEAEHLEISTLELDLGTFTEESFRIHFEAAYREKLNEVLELCIANPVVYGVSKVTKQKQLSEILFHFLRYGSLPWNIEKKYKNIDFLFFEVVKYEGTALKKFLLTYGHYTSLQRRLVFQLDDNVLKEGIKLIAPGESSFVLSYIHFLQAKYKAITASVKIGEQDYRNVVWEVVYAYLLNNKSSFFSIKSFLKYTIAALAARCGLSYNDLLKIVTYELEKQHTDKVARLELYTILSELKRETPDEPSGKSIIRMARIYISVMSVQRESPQWKNNRRILEDILKKQDTCRFFLQHLTETEVINLVKIIIPDEHSFVLGYTKSLERQTENGMLQGKAGGEFRLLKWQIIFPVLLQSSGFSRKYFVLQTLQKIASHYNLYVNELLAYLITPAKEKVLPESLIAILEQVYKELSGNSMFKEKVSLPEFKEEKILGYIRIGKELDAEELRYWKTVLSHTILREKILARLHFETQHTGFIRLLFPLQVDNILAYAAGLDIYNKKAALEGKTGGSFLRMKWKFINAVLFEPQHNVFNTKYFAERVLLRISAHYNLKMGELLEFFYREVVPGGNAIPFELIKVLKELYYDKVTIRENAPEIDKRPGSYFPEQKAAERLYRYFGKEKALEFLIGNLTNAHEFINFIDEVLRIELLVRNYFINELYITVDTKAVLKLIIRFSSEYQSLTLTVIMRRILLYYAGLITDNRKVLLWAQKLKQLSLTNILVKETISDLATMQLIKKGSTDTINEKDKKEESLPKEKAVEEYISNAGLVLLHPYLPRLFAMLSLTEDGRFTGEEAQFRGMFLMQYAVFGNAEFPEHEMKLNKLLAGVGQEIAIPRTVVLTAHEKETVDSLLDAVISAWSKLGNTSIEGLRGTFLVRDGRFDDQDDFYQLLVEEKAFDMLLDSLPWSISTIKYSWMEKGINIKWR